MGYMDYMMIIDYVLAITLVSCVVVGIFVTTLLTLLLIIKPWK